MIKESFSSPHVAFHSLTMGNVLFVSLALSTSARWHNIEFVSLH